MPRNIIHKVKVGDVLEITHGGNITRVTVKAKKYCAPCNMNSLFITDTPMWDGCYSLFNFKIVEPYTINKCQEI